MGTGTSNPGHGNYARDKDHRRRLHPRVGRIPRRRDGRAEPAQRRNCNVLREGAGFAVEEMRPYGPNVLSFEVVSGRRRWYIIGCYLAPDDARTIERVVTTLGDQPRGTALIVAGDLNTDLGDMECDGRGAEIATAITEVGLEDMVAHFLPRKRKWGRERRT